MKENLKVRRSIIKDDEPIKVPSSYSGQKTEILKRSAEQFKNLSDKELAEFTKDFAQDMSNLIACSLVKYYGFKNISEAIDLVLSDQNITASEKHDIVYNLEFFQGLDFQND